MSKKILSITLAALTMLISFQPSMCLSPRQATEVNLEGELKGAPYRIRVPANWNGTLVIYAHGLRDRADHPGEVEDRNAYVAPDPREFPQLPDMEEFLLERGYALAASAYRANGWAVEEGLKDTLRLTRFFKEQVGTPARTILLGLSMGSIIALKSMEQYKKDYDGAVCACGAGAGTSRAWDLAGAFSLAYDVAFGWPSSWGSVADVRDDIDFETEVLPVVFGQLTDQANIGRFEFLRLVNGLPAEGFYDGNAPAPTLIFVMFAATEARAELERRAGGPIVQNLDHTYSLTSEQKGYLASLGVDADSLLARMNAGRNISADKRQRKYLERNADFSGNIRSPVLSIHNRIDGLTPASHESVYRSSVEAAGREDLLLQVFTDSAGHCTFTQEQLLSAVKAIESWIDTGRRPGAELFPDSLGFVPNFVPPAWPQP